ncbi:RGCVC family protein [Amycolatopsis sp. VS8301801F10]|uniref:RGCVC family protein n=1 Tax=Amycolatopsis sp. VS8301801F10 TaxID=2652442 RepID=UPI0038FC68A7
MNSLRAAPPPAARPAGTCPVCRHEKTGHDAIAERFCAATAAAGHHRGCACAAGSTETAEEDGNMARELDYVSRYDQRLAAVRDVLKQDTGLTDAACQALAARLLHLLDEAPEQLRR